MKKINISIKKIHIAVIILGTIFILLAAFHTGLWFDESYSVALAKHSFIDIWNIDSYDVHPVFYYWMLKIVNIIFGNNILAYRLFSTISLIILGIIGYTHIRKDFGEKEGLLFSFLTFFLPVNLVYATEIRMYTWAMLFVTLMAIYAYRITKEGTKKNWIIFAIFSLISAYTHYYALITAGVINVILFIYVIRKIIKDRKNEKITKDNKHNLISFITSAIIQILLYIPWLFCFIRQYSQVSKGFWISLEPDILLQILEFQISGNLGGTKYINKYIALLFGVFILIYAIILLIKEKKKENKVESRPAILSTIIYVSVIAITYIVSIKTPVLYARYILNISGLFMIFISLILAKGNKYINAIAVTGIVIMSIYVNVNCIKENYDISNMEPIKYVRENVQKDDIILFDDKNSGFTGMVIIANMPEYQSYFYDIQNWNVEKAYAAYGPNMKTIYDIEELKDYHGRIWVIEECEYNLLEQELPKIYDNINILEQKKFTTKYKGYRYAISLISNIK